MKKFIKKSVIILLAFLFLMPGTQVYAAGTANGNACGKYEVSQEAVNYINGKSKEIKELVLYYKDLLELDVKDEEVEDLQIGDPYIILELSRFLQDEIYYFPIMDSEGRTILVAEVLDSENGWQFSLTVEMVETLNSLDYGNRKMLFVQSDSGLIASFEGGAYRVLEGKKDSLIDNFLRKDYSDQVLLFRNAVDFKLIDACLECKTSDVEDEYTREFIHNSANIKVHKLHNQKGQGNEPICWAASVATIVNYIKGRNVSAHGVCDAIGVPYKGGDYDDINKGLRYYGVTNYNHRVPKKSGFILEWSTLKKSVDNKWPMYLSSEAKGKGHGVVAMGYNITDSKQKYVWLWNPGQNGGKGGGQIVEYNDGVVCYPYNNKTFVVLGIISVY